MELLFQQASSVFISGGSTLNVLDLSAHFLIFCNFNFFLYILYTCTYIDIKYCTTVHAPQFERTDVLNFKKMNDTDE